MIVANGNLFIVREVRDGHVICHNGREMSLATLACLLSDLSMVNLFQDVKGIDATSVRHLAETLREAARLLSVVVHAK